MTKVEQIAQDILSDAKANYPNIWTDKTILFVVIPKKFLSELEQALKEHYKPEEQEPVF